ncbi:MAG: hypothetical protein JNM89_15305 [Hyphomicrobiaceae bacterium]|nr:hypothetical protein [Hyphomicrobiaceae bacterium]
MKKDVIRHAYDTTVDRLARLAAFAFSDEPSGLDEDVRSRLRQQAIDDLVTFAISLRRLTEVINLVAFSKGIAIPTAQPRTDSQSYWFQRTDSVTIWVLLGTIVHAQTYRIARSEFEIAMLLGHEPLDTLVKLNGVPGSSCEPLFALRSDHKTSCFALRDLVMRSGGILDAARSAGSQLGLTLDLDLRDP